METVLTTHALTRKFGDHKAVDQVDLHIRPGEIYGLIGRNGAGKTTVLKMAAGLIRPTEGSVELFGMTVEQALACGRLAKVGALIEAPGLHGGMTGYDNVRLKCLAAGIPPKEEYIMELMETVGLTEAAYKKAGHYSLGMRQRLGIALALVGEPELLILDEPINGLDPQGIAEVREILLRLHEQRQITILISSHILEELAKIITVCGILDNGRLLREFSREEMERECSDRVVIKTDAPQDCLPVLAQLGLTRYSAADEHTVEVFEGVDRSPAMIAALAAAGIPLREVYTDGQTLEEFFLHIVGGEGHE